MLPGSTSSRKKRDGVKRDSRSVEISRLIGRSLRQAIDLYAIGENTITIDCDVLRLTAVREQHQFQAAL